MTINTNRNFAPTVASAKDGKTATPAMVSRHMCLAFAACTAFTLITPTSSAAQSGNVVVQPIGQAEQAATPTVPETLMGIVDRVDTHLLRVDTIKSDHVNCRAIAVREGDGEASEPQLLSCGVDLEVAKIHFREDTARILKESSVDAAVQEELIEKDVLVEQAALDQTRDELGETVRSRDLLEDAFRKLHEVTGPPKTLEEQGRYNDLDRKWRELDSREQHLRTIHDIREFKLERLEIDKVAMGELAFALKEASFDQAVHIQNSKQWIEKAKETGEVLVLVTQIPTSMEGIGDALLKLGPNAIQDPLELPSIAALGLSANGSPVVAPSDDGYAAFLNRLDLNEGGVGQ